MKKLRILLIVFLGFLLNGCSLLLNYSDFQQTTESFIDAILKEDYNKAVSFMALEHESAKGTDVAALKFRLGSLHNVLTSNFGNKLNYSFGKTEKHFSSGPDNQPANTSILYLEIDNGKNYVGVEVLFDDTSKKIMNINLQDSIYPVPDLTSFWIFSAIALLVLLFNIYAIIRVKKSLIKKKWQKYLLIIFLNIPTFGWNAAGGFFYKLLTIQGLGIGFSMMGYQNTTCIFGLPIGAFLVLWKLKNHLYETTEPEDFNEINNLEVSNDIV